MDDDKNTGLDLSSAIDTVREMLSGDDGQAKLNNIISAFTGSDSESGSNSQAPDFNQFDMIIKMGNIMSALKSNGDGKSAALLYALKPYLSPARREKTDSAVKIMGMVKTFSVLKESGFSFDL